MNRDNNGELDVCQLQGVIRASPTTADKGVPAVVRLKRVLKRHLSVRSDRKLKDAISSIFVFLDRLRGRTRPKPAKLDTERPGRLNAGDLVRVRSQEEIQSTLDRWNSLKGCGFLSEMVNYCGTTQRVLKRVERFIDERDYRLKKASGIVLLESALCSGTRITGRCDRACFFFWREEWLEKLAGPDGPKG